MLSYLLDEHQHNAIAKALIARGIGVETAHSSGMMGRDDSEIIRYALAAGLVIVTNDDDFLRLAANVDQHSGVAYYVFRSRSLRVII
jgi:predicted nuclease of predicted toxin-antitoxin system